MAKVRRGLGRGLGALISDSKGAGAGAPSMADEPASASSASSGVAELPLDSIQPSPWQPRQMFDDDRLEELARSILEQGLVQPLVVRRKGDVYELVAGERRMRALRKLKRDTAPAVIMNATDAKMRELALVENLQRDDLNAIEVAHAYEALLNESDLTHELIATRLGVSRSRVTNTLRLLELPEEVKGMVSNGRLSAGHARALLSLPDPLSQIRLAKRAVSDRLSVRDMEKMTAKRGGAGGRPKKAGGAKEKAPEALGLEERLRNHLNTKVVVQDKGGKGTITVHYYSPEDAGRICDKMNLPHDPS